MRVNEAKLQKIHELRRLVRNMIKEVAAAADLPSDAELDKDKISDDPVESELKKYKSLPQDQQIIFLKDAINKARDPRLKMLDRKSGADGDFIEVAGANWKTDERVKQIIQRMYDVKASPEKRWLDDKPLIRKAKKEPVTNADFLASVKRKIGAAEGPKWDDKTQEAFKTFVNSKVKSITGTTKDAIIANWKVNGPKITAFNEISEPDNIKLVKTGDIKGLYWFIKLLEDEPIEDEETPSEPEKPSEDEDLLAGTELAESVLRNHVRKILLKKMLMEEAEKSDSRTVNWLTDTLGSSGTDVIKDLLTSVSTASAAGLGSIVGTIAMPGVGTLAGGATAAATMYAYLTQARRDKRNKVIKNMINAIYGKNFNADSPDIEPEMLALIKKEYGPWADYSDATASTAQINTYRVTQKKIFDDFYGNVKKTIQDNIDSAPPAVKNAIAKTKDQKPVSEIVIEIQKILGVDPQTGKWDKERTQPAFEKYVRDNVKSLEGTTVNDIVSNWKENGPKITKVNGIDKTFTGDAAGVLDFLQTIKPAATASDANSAAPAPDAAAAETSQAAEAPASDPSAVGLAKVLRFVSEGDITVDVKGFDTQQNTMVWSSVTKALGGPTDAGAKLIDKAGFSQKEKNVLTKYASMDDDPIIDSLSEQTLLNKLNDYFYGLKKQNWGPFSRSPGVVAGAKKELEKRAKAPVTK